MTTRVIVMRDRFVQAYPSPPRSPNLEAAAAPEVVFTREFTTDTHFQACAPATTPPRRLCMDALAALPSPPIMVLLVADVDGPGHAASAEWRTNLCARAPYLPGQPFGYFTRGGARLVWRIPPTPVENTDAWSRWYLEQLVVLVATAGIVADPACHDWPHLFRAPHATRDGEPQRHGWACGSPTEIGMWPAPELAEVDRLAAVGFLEAHSPAWRQRLRRFDPLPPPRPVDASVDASKAIAWAVRQVEGAGKGGRNREVFGRTRWLRSLVERGELAVDQVVEAMVGAATRAGLTRGEAVRTVRSALRGGS